MFQKVPPSIRPPWGRVGSLLRAGGEAVHPSREGSLYCRVWLSLRETHLVVADECQIHPLDRFLGEVRVCDKAHEPLEVLRVLGVGHWCNGDLLQESPLSERRHAFHIFQSRFSFHFLFHIGCGRLIPCRLSVRRDEAAEDERCGRRWGFRGCGSRC